MPELNQGGVHGSNALWDYIVINACWKSYIIYQDQSGFSCPNQKGKGDNNHNVVNKEIMPELN